MEKNHRSQKNFEGVVKYIIELRSRKVCSINETDYFWRWEKECESRKL